eukprot:gene3643-4537_t
MTSPANSFTNSISVSGNKMGSMQTTNKVQCDECGGVTVFYHPLWFSLPEDHGLNSVGLFGIPELSKGPEGWEDLYNKEVRHIESLLDRIHRSKIQYSDDVHKLSEILYLIDDISASICRVMDTAELCRSVISGSTHGKAADQFYKLMGNFVHNLNADPSLHNIFKMIREHREFIKLPEEHQIFIQDMMKESESNGIGLPSSLRDKVIELKTHIDYYGGSYIQGVNQSSEEMTVKHLPVNRNILKALPTTYQSYIPTKGGLAQISTHPYIVDGVLKYISDPDIRRDLFMLSKSTIPKETLHHLHNMLVKRHELATTLGFQNYSDYHLESKLIKKTENAIQFLERLSEETRNQSEKELNLLYSYKCKQEMTGDPIYQWDYPYYSHLVQLIQNRQQGSPTPSDLSEFFPLENVIAGLDHIVKNLFGLQLVQVDMEKGESWSEQVIKLELRSSIEGVLGSIYMDVWRRNGKVFGAMNYLLQSGYRKYEFNSKHSHEIDIPINNEYHTPKVAIICGFPLKNPENPLQSTLDHSDLITLFHEFGHSLHTLLSRTRFQHLSGTRGPFDFIEIPSSLMENFTWDHKTLSQFAVNPKSGRSLSKELLDSHRESEKLLKGIETQEQICLALFDLKLHSKEYLNEGKTPWDILEQLQSKHMGISGGSLNTFINGFIHLYLYGSSYYSYLMARDQSQKIWTRFFGDGKNINFERGDFYRRNFLQKGASKDPTKILQLFNSYK